MCYQKISITKYAPLNSNSSMKKKICRKFTLKVKFQHFLTPPHCTNSQHLTISFDYSWFLAKILSNFLSLPWKLHNRYCHTVDQTIDKIEVSSSWLTIEYYFWRIILGTDHEEGGSSTSELQQSSARHFHEKKGKGIL